MHLSPINHKELFWADILRLGVNNTIVPLLIRYIITGELLNVSLFWFTHLSNFKRMLLLREDMGGLNELM